ncbi:double-strand break repair helicase AddA [Alisedimentitalea sp. MJ-SS2]|uniref:double-strand break repair helicase AddA n=1 Tax=Aliisedimentitalea sp. MJ-SS2 TaxID=3049795 RepID=UPI002912CA5C|nr:double-strand break repair helicase AddA [Alisedimentitalea sp. MJ-SS2]MDU8927951.1 double-strand break repair helicase AddA [Alisedimentitalea sp. MJ-SS2]
MSAPNDATLAQIKAARPDQSTWLSANAGSGKTRVLTDRVARLLLDEVNPQHILCLTYTKAAASEMQNRLFARLGEWAMLPDADLRKELAELGISETITQQKLTDARRLFASAIETPGGLKIQTIHAFCSSILRRFPLEAGVSPRFAEMDDRTAALLRQDVLEQMAESEDRALVEGIVGYLSGDDALDMLAAEICRYAEGFSAESDFNDLLTTFDLPAGFTETTLSENVFAPGDVAILASLMPVLREGSVTDQQAANKLTKLGALDLSALPILESVFLTGASAKMPFSAKLGSFPTKATQAKLGPVLDGLQGLMTRIQNARNTRLALLAARQTHALHQFAGAFLTRYEIRKQAHGWLDFDDLIQRTRTLMNNPQVAAWVLFRLDGGIDHILVDEAQDTSPAQWNVIERLAQEFTAGEGARADVLRTIFVVGDKKQSIYSFQGADPREFDRMQAEFAERLEGTNHPLQSSVLKYSFRSSHAILSLVDQTFKGREAAGFASDQTHKAFFESMPGRVDLWPVVEKEDRPEQKDWYDPVDMVGPDDPVSILAREIARGIKSMVENAHIPVQLGRNGGFALRPVHAGDVLILVQRRSLLFHAIIRECKALNLPIAGADRLRIGGELAVRDIEALLRFLATPEDDLSLATALKSPLFGWDEQALFTLSHGRKGYLWEALRDQAADHPKTMSILDDLRSKADYLRPFDLIERMLTRHDGRRKLLARLGHEAEDGIDALLSQALNYEHTAVPSLTGFLVWLETDEVEIKRQMEGAGRQIRVMTVHGAKGLEAPIVILPDTAKRDIRIRDALLKDGDRMFWRPPSNATPSHITTLIEARKQREAEERERLLYVAMTRAEKWLIVAAAGDAGIEDDASWYNKIAAALTARGAVSHGFEGGDGLRLEHGNWAELETLPLPEEQAQTAALPIWHDQPAPIPAPRPTSLSPSDLGGAKALPGEAGLDEEAALRRGRQIHRLLEFLPAHPANEWPDVAGRILFSGQDNAGSEEQNLLLAEAENVLTKPGLAALFQTAALAEVPITADLPTLSGRRIHGIIDRLVITDEEILAVDFKTNAVVPDSVDTVPDGLLRQMGAYAQALEQVFPGRKIQTALLWTRNATLMRLPHDLVIHALATTQMLDAPGPDT